MSIFKYNGKDIYYELHGSDKLPPLLILNGIMMSTRSWIPFLPTLKEHFQVMLVDFFDQGQSSKLEGETYKQEIQIDMLDALLEHLYFDKISIAGISYGGEVALAYACKYQARVNRLILFNATAYTNPWLKDIGEAWIEAGRTRDGSLYYHTTIPSIYSFKFYESKIEWMKQREKILNPVFSNGAFLDAMERLTRSAESYDVRDKLDKLDLPVMIVSAEHDILTPVQEQEYLNKKIKNSIWIKLPDVGHASMYESPLAFTSLIIGFFLAKDTIYNV